MQLLRRARALVGQAIFGGRTGFSRAAMLAIARAKFLTGKIDLFVTFTTACNYDCAFCNRDVDKAMIRLKDVARVDALARHARYVDVTGYGEPTLHPEFDDIIRHFSARRVPIRFVTNGSRMTPARVDLLRSASMKEVVVSLNSLDPATYVSLHRGQAALEPVLRNTKDLLARRNFAVSLSMVVTAKNLHEIPHFIEFAREHRPTSVACLGLTPTLRDRYPGDLVVPDTPETRAFLAEMRRAALRAGVSIMLPDLANQATAQAPVPPEQLRTMIRSCDWVYTKVFVDETGAVYPCCWSRMKMGDVRTQSLDEVWHGPRYVELRRAVRTGYHPSCSECRRLN